MNENRELSYYKHTTPISTRWSDNDQYGHLNNSVYYTLFDAVVNQYLITRCGLNVASETGEDVAGGGPIGLVVASGCRYHAALSFPHALTGGLTIAKLGRTSVTYHIGIFPANETGARAAASGWFTHVFVDPKTRRPVSMTRKCRAGFLRIATEEIQAQEGRSKL